MIEVEGLCKRYGEFTAVDGLSFQVAAGQIMGLVGPNGAGKTTTLRCLAGIIPASLGQVRIGGMDIATDPVAAKRQLAFIPDEPRLFEHLTVEQHLNFVARLYAVADWRERGTALLDELEMADKRQLLPSELSRGMKQKLAIACGLLHAPRAVILDEPLTGLDPIASGVIMSLIRRLSRSLGLASIVVSHHVNETLPIADRAVVIANGGIVFDGTPQQLRASADPLLRQFLDGEPDGPIPFESVAPARRAEVA